MQKKHKIMISRLALSAVVLVCGLLADVPQMIKLCIYLLSYAIIGYDVVINAVKNVFTLKFLDENFLMALASVGAFCIGDYPEAVSVMLFYQLGELFLSLAVNKSRKSITSLMDLSVEYANRYENGKSERISPYELEVGEYIMVKTGEKVPVDCVICEGNTTLDTAALTGESLPRSVKEGDSVLSGSVNIANGFVAKVEKKYENSTAARILELAQNAAHKKAKTEKFITRFAKYYTPAVVVLALLIAFVPGLFFGLGFANWIERGLSFLVVSCPCALVISVPLGFFAGIGSASANGSIIKGSVAIEKLEKVKCAVFDKTGTLTDGKVSVKEFETKKYANENIKLSDEEILRLSAYAENMNNHPVGNSIKAYYKKSIDMTKIKDTQEFTGMGVGAVIDGHKVYVGNAALAKKLGCTVSDGGDSMVFAIIDGYVAAHFKFGDKIKANAARSIKELKKNGIEKCIMLTGDNEKHAAEAADALSLDGYYSSLLPADKVEKLEEIQKNTNGQVMFVGDGINDSPVLITADVGIAMGMEGSDAAVEAADIVIMNDDLSCIAKAVKISKKTMGIVRENIVFAIGVKILVLALSALGIAGIWAAVFADVGVALLAVLNALRCLTLKK